MPSYCVNNEIIWKNWNKIAKDDKGEDVPHLEFTEIN